MKKLLLILTIMLSFSANADVYKDFQINGDTWVINTDSDYTQIVLCLQTASKCVIGSTGILDDYHTPKRDGVTAREYYQGFIDKANQKIAQYYQTIDVAPPEDDFNAFIDYLIKEGTLYDSSIDNFVITK